MLDGFLRENSKDLGRIQIIFDPLIITSLFSILYSPLINSTDYQNIPFIIFILTYVFLSKDHYIKVTEIKVFFGY